MKSLVPVKLLTIRSTAFPPAAIGGGNAVIEDGNFLKFSEAFLILVFVSSLFSFIIIFALS